MIEELKEERLVQKVGGRFKLSALIQKRLIALNKRAIAFVETDGLDELQIVINEILQDRIFLEADGSVGERQVGSAAMSATDINFDDLA
ncbi:MAG: DNA-directed RNA polymerase subunit omega [Planctomycetaceae bacterium]|jgi:DNA-directed RNA polymerase subunit omega|nr:DNA-directed RNA polymerase subunit omega [Planctomycetaceae bacterium]